MTITGVGNGNNYLLSELQTRAKGGKLHGSHCDEHRLDLSQHRRHRLSVEWRSAYDRRI